MFNVFKFPNILSAGCLVLLIAACGTSQKRVDSNFDINAAAAGLGELTTALHEDMLLRRKMDLFAAMATDHYVVMVPGGTLETRQENIDGAKNFNVTAVNFSNVVTRTHGRSAVVTGRWSLMGRLGKQDMSGDYEFMSIYEHVGGKWALVAESITRRKTLLRSLAD